MMRSAFDHEDLRVYQTAIGFVASTVHDGKGHLSTLVSMKDRCRFIGHARTAALQAAATLDVLAVRQAKGKQDVTEGKSCLADIVRMLVAWERKLEER